MAVRHRTATTADDPPLSTFSVGICYPGGRLEKIKEPLDTTPLDVTVAPENPDDHDILVLDMPGENMVKPLLAGSTPATYRIRGNLWRASRYWLLGAVKSGVSTRYLFPRLAGAIPADPYLEAEFQNRTANTDTAAIGLPITASEWPDTAHASHELRAVTLTNADYHGKVDPIVEAIPVVDRVLTETGGWWLIGGDGRFENTLAAAAADADHVQYGGFIDAETWLQRANVLLHPSSFDIQLPNAILEGMASHLPVVTSGFPPFRDHEHLISADTAADLEAALQLLTDPDRRAAIGDENEAYVHEHHDPEVIGEQYHRFLEGLL